MAAVPGKGTPAVLWLWEAENPVISAAVITAAPRCRAACPHAVPVVTPRCPHSVPTVPTASLWYLQGVSVVSLLSPHGVPQGAPGCPQGVLMVSARCPVVSLLRPYGHTVSPRCPYGVPVMSLATVSPRCPCGVPRVSL